MKKYIVIILLFIISGFATSADYDYQNSNGQLSIEYSEIANGKTLQKIQKNGTLIAQHCYQNGKRIKDSTFANGAVSAAFTHLFNLERYKVEEEVILEAEIQEL